MNENEQRNLIPRPDVTTPILALVTKLRGGKPVSDTWRKRWHIHTYVIRGFWFLFNRKMLRRYAFTFASLVTLIALGYAVENWRGRKAWSDYKNQMVSSGTVMDWDVYVSTNQALKTKAPEKSALMVRSLFQTSSPSGTNRFSFGIATMPAQQVGALAEYPASLVKLSALPKHGTNEVTVEKLISHGGTNVPVSIETHVGKSIPASLDELMELSGLALDKTSRKTFAYSGLWLRSEMIPDWTGKDSLEVLVQLLRSQGYTVEPSDESGKFRYKKDASLVTFTEWFRVSRPWMNELVHALQQKGYKLELDTRSPLDANFHNYVAVRTLAQTFVTGARVALLNDSKSDYLFYLNGMKSLVDFMAEPPYLMVSAMVEIALASMYAEVMEDGLRLKIFSVDELRRFKTELEQVNLIDHFKRSIGGWERLRVIAGIESLPREGWMQTFGLVFQESGKFNWVDFAVKIAPRGWYYQNLQKSQSQTLLVLQHLDSEHRVMDAGFLQDYYQKTVQRYSKSMSPYEMLHWITFPNYGKALQTLAVNQTKMHLLSTACALEEYRLEQGSHPEKLTELMPKYIAKVPNDVIDGQPLRFRREAPDSFVLYSIGWNLKDEGGMDSEAKEVITFPKPAFTVYRKDYTQGDWVLRSKPLVVPK